MKSKGTEHPETLNLSLKNAENAMALKREFACGIFVPEWVVALYNAMNAADAYKKAEKARIATENTTLVNEILGMTKPYTEE